uniref:LysM and putative peptidoglycan-binding domain-containing protein n=1 Tax=Plautia stali TaxID=106108 RepID=A0A499UI13_PLAST|nr:LysM and putative peptidoglycan-binding domain-containing protein [Plautia stali]
MEISMEERIAIRDSARPLKKYGSTSNYNCKRQDQYIKHQVKQSDTLQGLALKYGVTTEEIRRANRLWANDSIFLRESLLIPCSSPSTSVSPSEDSGLNSPSNGQYTSEIDNRKNGDVEREDSYSDFLVKIDCAIATTKTQVITAQGNSEFIDDDSIFWRRKGPSSRTRRDSECSGCDGNSSSSSGSRPSEVVVMTQGRKVRDSLQRLEKERDEIFEL